MSYSSPKDQDEASPSATWLLEGDFNLFPSISPTDLMQEAPGDPLIPDFDAQGSEITEVPSPPPGEKDDDPVDTHESTDIRARRRIQNRVAQRAFRERKQTYARDLEHKVQDAQKEVEQLRAEKTALQHVLQSALMENQRLQRELERRPPPDPILSALLDRVKSTNTSSTTISTPPEKQPPVRDDGKG